MILAAPLVIPFAEAVGISIATLGMAKAADMVNDYIQENPEESAMILKTLVPNLGIGEIFMNKEKISLEDLDEMTDEEAQDLSKEEKAELMKQAGKSGGGKNKRQTMIDLSEKLGLSGEGKEKQDIEYEVDERYDEGGVEDAPKPKFDYKKFFKKRYADGGAIGIEVLFEEKKKNGGRVGLFMGGSPLEGQALSIYDSMKAYNFSDQEIANALSAQGLYTPVGTTPDAPTTIQPIGFQGGSGGGGGGGGITELLKTYTKETAPPQKFTGDPTAQLTGKGRLDPMGSGFDEILKSVTASNTNRVLTDDQLKQKAFFQEVYQDPKEISFFDKAKSGLQSFKDKFFQPKVRGTLGTRVANQPKLPLPGAIAAYSMSPFNPDSRNFNPLLEGQLNFLELGDNLIGRDPGTGGLKYGSGSVLSGKNVISGFGTNNYDTALRNFISKMKSNTRISDERKKVRIDAAEKELLDLQTKSKKGLGRDVDRGGFDPSGPTQRSIREEREDRSGRGQSGGFTNPGKGSYGPFMADGGLATMFTRRR